MEPVLRALSVYIFLLVLFRVAGRRALSEVTTFDFVLLLIIGESTQQALIGNDFSVVNAMVIITTLVTVDIAISILKHRSGRVDKVIDGTPLIIVQDGRLLHDRLAQVQVDESDIMTAAREMQGIERLEQIKYAVLERSGGISIIPKKAG
jgi:uncharacterized membrane protein YcaP (DUF421 family)